VESQDDPWTWAYYYGPRFLPSNRVLAVVPDIGSNGGGSGGGNDNAGRSVLVVTEAGLTYLRADPMTLEEKARALQTMQFPRHNRHGLIGACSLDEYGDLSTYHKTTGDNDGSSTGRSTIAQTYRYMHSLKNGGTGDADALTMAWAGFEALEQLSYITGSYPSFIARTLCKVSDGDIGCTAPDPECWYECWHDAPNRPGWQYKGDTSSDELTSHFATYGMIHDSIAQTDAQRARVLTLLEGLLMGIIENDLYFIDPFTNERTFWGFWNPKEINHEVEHYSERGLNSLQILSWLTQAYSITGKRVYYDQYWDLVNNHRYVENTFNVKIDSAVDENHSDNELIWLSYHTLFYSLSRLGVNHPRRAEVQAMVDPMLPSLEKTFMIMRVELSPFWLAVYAGTAAQVDSVTAEDISDAQWSLRRWALDNIEWDIHGSHRVDLDFNIMDEINAPRGNPAGHIMRYIRPPSERIAQDQHYDPFDVDPGGSGMVEDEPGLWLLPYYLMLYYDLI
jgi:hypothetical protein